MHRICPSVSCHHGLLVKVGLEFVLQDVPQREDLLRKHLGLDPRYLATPPVEA
jgi:hypothetical protein